MPWRHLALLVLFLAGATASLLELGRLRQPLVFETFHVGDTAPIPVDRVRLAGRDSYPVHFLLLHGHSANRRMLLQPAEVLAAAGADVYVPDLPGRGDHTGRVSPLPPTGLKADIPTPRETQAALAVLRHLQGRLGVRPERLVVMGHSLGGGVALDVARRVSPAATVSLAGLERPVEPDRPRNLLLITARLEIPALRRAADRMYERVSAGTVAGRREFVATHASLPLHPPVQRAIVQWTNQTVPGTGLVIPPLLSERLLGLELSTLFCLAGLFVPLAGLAGWALAHGPWGEVVPETRFSFWSPLHLAGYALLAGAVTVSGLRLLAWHGWRHPLSFLRLEGGDYLASVLLLAAVWLLPVFLRRPWVRSPAETAAGVCVAVALGAYVVFAGGWFANWQLFDLWPTPGRFLKMLLLALVLLPYTSGEELLTRTFAKQHGSSPLSALLVWRLGLFAAVAGGAWLLGTGQAMLVLLGLPFLLLSLLEYFFSTALYRALGSAYASGVLKAILLNWFIATAFPLR